MVKRHSCPKCGHTSDAAFDVCTNCGIVVTKFLQRRERIKQASTASLEAERAGDTRNAFLRIILRGWLFPVPLMLVQIWVLSTSETIWTSTVYYASRYTISQGVAGNHAIFSVVFFPLLYWTTYTPLISALADRFGSGSGSSETGAGCAAILIRVVSFLLLCLTTYQTVVRYGQF